MSSLKIAEILRGCEAGVIQSVGYMQVIPLISELQFDNYVPPRPGQVSTSSYGTMEFNNDTDSEMIIPAHTACLTKRAQQDHSMMSAGYVEKKRKSRFSNAVCIQQSQPGVITANNDNRLIILPYPLRETAYKNKSQNSYDRMWPHISQLMSTAEVRHTGGNLVKFFDKYDEQLEQFVAEFEPIEDQVGAIILIGGELVGIERVPSYKYWLEIWPMLIRECYGSLAVIEANKHDGPPPVPKTRAALRKANSLEDLKTAIEEAKEKERKRVSDLVNNICSNEVSLSEKENFSNESLETIIDDASGFVGQLIRKSKKVIYASLIATNVYRENADWLNQDEFSM